MSGHDPGFGDPGFEELLRRALHEAADRVEPAGDGLERIRGRLGAPRPAPVAWLMTAWDWAAWRARGGLESAWAWLRTTPAAARDGARGAAPDRWRQLARLRPAVAVAAAVAVVAVGASLMTPLPGQALAQARALITAISGSSPPAGPSGPRVSRQGAGTPTVSSSGSSGTASGSQATGAAPAPSSTACATTAPGSPATSPVRRGTASPGPASSSPAPAASPSPSASGSPGTPGIAGPDASPSPSGSGGPAPAGSPAPSASGSPAPSPTPSASPSAAGVPGTPTVSPGGPASCQPSAGTHRR